MKYEPLKLKDLKQSAREIFADKEKFAYIQNSAQRKMDHEYGFLHAISIVEGRVKSAVQGLLQEIDKLPTETIYDKIAETRDGMAIAPFEFIKKKSVIDLIKKWFPDVVEGEG